MDRGLGARLRQRLGDLISSDAIGTITGGLVLEKARLLVDLGKITDNTSAVVAMLGGIEVVGVTKCVCGSPEVATAMLAGGAVALGESRHESAQRLRDAGLTTPLWLLRMPPPARAGETVRLFDISLASEVETCMALDRAAAEQGVRHKVVAMLELGDLREGMMPSELPAFVAVVDQLSHLELVGLGTNLTCYGAVAPDETNMNQLIELARAAERQVGHRLIVSAGSSGSISMVVSGRMPQGVTSLRVGESILHGVDALTRWPISGLHTDAFILEAPVVESKLKPSAPHGFMAQNAWGDTPVFQDRGVRRRAICALGRQDCRVEGLTPYDPRVYVLGASSDHLLVDVDSMMPPPLPGDVIRLRPDYVATLQLFTSAFVEKVFVSRDRSPE